MLHGHVALLNFLLILYPGSGSGAALLDVLADVCQILSTLFLHPDLQC